MDKILQRGLSHILKMIPSEKPTGLTNYQNIYYDCLKKDITCIGELKSIGEKIKNIENDDQLWFLMVLRFDKKIIDYSSENKKNRIKVLEFSKELDIFPYLPLEESVDIMMKRSVEEKNYFNIAKIYYNVIVNYTKNIHPLYFFGLEKNQLVFLREQLAVEVAEFELSYKAYEIYKTKDYQLVGMPQELYEKNDIFYIKLLEITDDVKKYYDKLRKHTEYFLNNLPIKFINDKLENGEEVVDYPWYCLEFLQKELDLCEIKLKDDNCRPYSKVYNYKLKVNLIKSGEEEVYQIRNYQFVSKKEIEKKHIRNFLNHFDVK